MTEITVTITGIEPIIEGLGKIGAAKWLKELLKASAKILGDRTGVYPAPVPTYQRGWGPIYPSGRKSKRKTSENLGKQWYVKSTDFAAEVGNRASYSEFVHGERQAKFHGARGWRKLSDETTKEVDNLENQIDKKIVSLMPK